MEKTKNIYVVEEGVTEDGVKFIWAQGGFIANSDEFPVEGRGLYEC